MSMVMLLQFVAWISTDSSPNSWLAALEKITLRASLAAVVSFLLALALGPRLIAWLQTRFREPIKSASATIEALHQSKARTPTMGGIFIVAGIALATMLLCDWQQPYPAISLLALVGLATVGAIDDLAKLRTKRRGLSVQAKLAGQTLVAIVVAVLVYRAHAQLPDGLQGALPLVGGSISLGWWFVPLAVITIVGSSNAVNLTDGLDGLAGGCLVFATAAMAAVTYACAHAGWAEYLGIPHISGAGEMVVVAGGMLGAILGFLWFNCHPASVFMGDTGSLPLGGLLGLLAVVARQELLLLVVGGVFVLEALSVVLQVASYKWRRKRVFRCAPLHHHFQFQGWPESKIVVRFWIASALCAILGLLSLKAHVKPDTASEQPVVAGVVVSGRLTETLPTTAGLPNRSKAHVKYHAVGRPQRQNKE